MRLSDLCVYDRITIQCHDNPDADTIASGYGLYCYYADQGIPVRLVYCGKNMIKKSNLRLMVDKLQIPIEYISLGKGEVLTIDGLLITVDCQYGSGNVTGLAADQVAIIDHHQLDNEALPLSVIQSNLGSCSTLVWKLLCNENYDLAGNKTLGTALYYGLYSDTNQFSEIYNPLDMDMRDALSVDMNLITLFRNSNLTLKELEIAGIAMIRYSYNDDYRFAVIKAQPCDPNILGLISDFLLQVDAIDTCVVFHETGDGYKFSVRSCIKEVHANELASFLADNLGSGGGHREKAGGFINLKLYEDKYPTLHSEGYFSKRMMDYYDKFHIIYAGDYQVDISRMSRYLKCQIPEYFVNLTDVVPENTPVTIRTVDGDRNMTVSKDYYLIINRKGRIRPIGREAFEKFYRLPDPEHASEVDLPQPEYDPMLRKREETLSVPLREYTKICYPAQKHVIYARPLEQAVKVFPLWDKNNYLLGDVGDYLLVNSEDLQDILVMDKETFQRTYVSA